MAGRGTRTKGSDMLVLSRRKDERIMVGDNIVVTEEVWLAIRNGEKPGGQQ